MPREQLIQLRRDLGTPVDGALDEGEPAFDMTPGSPRLLIGDSAGAPLVLADPAYIAALEARILLLEKAVRELQFITFIGDPANPIPP